MSIWTDLLLLGGYVATPTGLAALAPETRGPASPAPRPAVATPAPAAPPTRVRVLPRPNKISPNDLW
jgi:hypothetical protein